MGKISKNGNPKSKHKPLVIKQLEKVSAKIFRNHYDVITKLVGSSHGIYALYNNKELYYIGKSTDLKRRIKHHLRDRHLASWTHFSLYLVRKEEHIHEIESLIIKIASPKGNRLIPVKSDKSILKEVEAALDQKHKEEKAELLNKNDNRAKLKMVFNKSHPVALKGLVTTKVPLFRAYKGKEYKAILTPEGFIKINQQKFKTPTAAAKKIVERGSVNGWNFWYIQNPGGEWVRLAEYKG